MDKKLLLLILLFGSLIIHYGYKLNKEIKVLQHNQMMFEQSIDCMKYLQENKGGVCD